MNAVDIIEEALHDLEYSKITCKEFDDIVEPFRDCVPVKRGHWIDIDSQMYTWKCRCSECGHERSMMSTQGRYPRFCENCGADMRCEE